MHIAVAMNNKNIFLLISAVIHKYTSDGKPSHLTPGLKLELFRMKGTIGLPFICTQIMILVIKNVLIQDLIINYES